MRKIIFLCLASLTMADTLQTLLIDAKKYNNLIKASKIEILQKDKELQTLQKTYYPTLNIAGFYKREDEASSMQPGTIYGAKMQVQLDLYKGGSRAYEKKVLKAEQALKKNIYNDTYENITLHIVKDFFNLKTLEAQLHALQDSQTALKAQLKRIKVFFDAKLATSDAVDRLQAAFESSSFAIASLKFQIFSLHKRLELQVGRKIQTLKKAVFLKNNILTTTLLSKTRSLEQTQKILKNKVKILQSYYYPQITLQDSYSLYGYKDEPNLGKLTPKYLSHQNSIEANIFLKLYDFGILNEKQEVLQLQVKAVQQRIDFQIKEQNMQKDLAKEHIKTTYLQLQSAKSMLKFSTNVLKSTTQKYTNGIVDNIGYLDALTTQTQAKSSYEKAKNDLEIAYAVFYYFNAENLQDFLK